MKTVKEVKRRHKPKAVLISDHLLGLLAKEREKGTPRKAYLTLDQVEERLKAR